MNETTTIPLTKITPLGRSSVTARDDTVMLVTDPCQWAYCAEVDFDIPGIENESQTVKISVEVESGVLGVGLLRDGTWLDRGSAAEGSTTKEISFSIPAQMRRGKFVFDNWTEGNRPARAVIRSIMVRQDRTQEIFQQLDASRLVIFEYSGGVGLFGTLTTCLNLSWKSRSAGLIPFFIMNAPHYIDQRYGDNWLEYYFVQRNVSDADRKKAHLIARNATSQSWRGGIRIFRAQRDSIFPATSQERLNNEMFDAFGINLSAVNQFFFQEFDFTREVKRSVQIFVDTHFKSHRVLGVHYRGTDKVDEADPVRYGEMIDIINQYESSYSKIFLTTDDPVFSELCGSAEFGKKVIFNTRPMRFDRPAPLEINSPHLREAKNNYQKGFDAVVEAVLLSRCDLLIKTSSTFSAWSKIFNPELPLVLVGCPYSNPWPGEIPTRGWGYWPESSFHGRCLEFRTANRIEREIPVENYPYSTAAVEQLRSMVPNLTAPLARQIIGFAEELRSLALYAFPAPTTIAEWATFVQSRCWRSLNLGVIGSTLGVLLKDERDYLKVQGAVAEQAFLKMVARLDSLRHLDASKNRPGKISF